MSKGPKEQTFRYALKSIFLALRYVTCLRIAVFNTDPSFRKSGANNSFDNVIVFVILTLLFAGAMKQLSLFYEMGKIKKSRKVAKPKNFEICHQISLNTQTDNTV